MKRYAFSILSLLVISLSTFANADIEIEGEWEQGGILFGHTCSGCSVSVNNKEIKITPTGSFVFGLDREADSETVIVVVNKKGEKSKHRYSVKQREYDVQRVNGVEEKHVNPPKAFTDRIVREAGLVNSARSLIDSREDFLQSFQWPIKGPITGVYGSQRVYNGVPKTPHYGIDIAAPKGARVTAPANGLVTLAESDLFYSGGTLIIDHGYGLSSTFMHLSKLLVKSGQFVTQGQEVAEVGATGRATGPHLDWRMNWMGVRVDPGLLMKHKPMN